MSSARRFSQAISEGEAISVLVEVGDIDGARRAEQAGAEALVVRGLGDDLHRATTLPILLYGRMPAFEGEADAVTVDVSDEPSSLEYVVARADELGLECVIKVRDEDELRAALDVVDPEILLLSGADAEDRDPLEHVLSLLPDVPAGKLAVAEAGVRSREELAELERAGVDAVIVRSADVAVLVGELPARPST